MSEDRPLELSIVLVIGERRLRAERALQSVLSQSEDIDCEIIIIDAAKGDLQPLRGHDHASVYYLRMLGNQNIGELRLSGLKAAGGEIVAFLEDHVTIEPGYMLAILTAFKDGWIAVGPVVQNANPNIGVSSAVHFLHYGLWNPLIESGEAEVIPGNNSAYRRSILALYGARLGRLLLTDMVLQMRLKVDRHRLYVEPLAQLNHPNATSLRTAAISDYLYHRCFIAERSHEFGWNRLDRIWAMVRTPLTPWVRSFRLARMIFVKNPTSRRRFLLVFPSIFLLQYAAAWGQFVGLLLGQGAAASRFTDFELSYSRRAAKD